MMMHTTTAYITAETGAGGDFFFLKRNKTTANAMTKIKNSTPPTIAAVDDFLSAPCFGPVVFPEEKPTIKYYANIHEISVNFELSVIT